jgi:hypothetical protein
LNRGKTRAPRQSVSQPAQPTVDDWNAELPFGQLEFQFYFAHSSAISVFQGTKRPENFSSRVLNSL